MEGLFDRVVAHAQESPVFFGLQLLLLVFVLRRLFGKSAPFPVVEGSRVRTLGSLGDFHALVAEAKSTGGLVVVDYYATWCPPCRSASGPYQKMSMLYDPSDAIFAKVNVDEAKDVSKAHEVRAMPTFKVFNGEGTEVESLQGWRESNLRNMIVQAINNRPKTT